jgi:glycosyltransferase involved in cell wall biosynthesis
VQDIEVYYPTHLDTKGWEVQNAQGLVPDTWPYGLNQLEGHLSATSARLSNLAPRANLSSTRRKKVVDVALAWEEDTALRMLLHSKAEVKLAGVIWATDRFASHKPKAKDRVIRPALRRLDRLWVLSPAQVPFLESWLGPNHPPIELLTFGVDKGFFRPAEPIRSPLLFSLGSDRDRDMRTLFSAFEIIASARPDVALIVQTSSQLPTPVGVTKISRVGHKDLRSLYQSATAVVIATGTNLHVSGMTAALESMACGRPVVITETAGMSHYVEHNRTGLLTPVEDAASLASAALRLTDDAAFANQLGAAGRTAVEERYNTREMAFSLSEMIERTLS